MNKIKKNVLYTVGCILIAVLIGTVAMIVVYMLPVDRMRNNVKKSMSIYNQEGDVYAWASGLNSTRLDNFTDTIILQNAVYLGSDSVVEDAMMNPWVDYEYRETMTDKLEEAVTNDSLSDGTVINYARYWHGYLVWLKPLLLFLSVYDIRLLGMIIQTLLLFAVLYEINKKLNVKYAFVYLLSMLMLNPISAAMSMQLGCVYTITLIASYFIMHYELYNREDIWKVFLWIGISVAFFDFFTYPVVALGIPLILVMLVGKGDFGKGFADIIKSSISWCIGYGCMWAGKWVISYILTGYNTIREGIDNAVYRVGGNTEAEAGVDSTGLFAGVKYNLKPFMNKSVLIIICVIVILVAYLLITKKCKLTMDKNCILLLLVGLYPIAWYVVIKNHSCIHACMTYRNTVVLIFALLSCMSVALKAGEKRR